MNLDVLLEYDQWATATLLEAVQKLSPADFTREFGGASTTDKASVRQQFAHLLSVQERYCARLGGEEAPDFPLETLATPDELARYAAHVQARVLRLWELHPDLDKVHHQATRRGVFHASTAETMFHMIHHATYHRGQIACLFKQLDIDFPDTDFIIWIQSRFYGDADDA